MDLQFRSCIKCGKAFRVLSTSTQTHCSLNCNNHKRLSVWVKRPAEEKAKLFAQYEKQLRMKAAKDGI